MRTRVLISEAVAGLAGRPTRTVLTVFGVVLGVAVVVATVGLTLTAGNAAATRFDESTANIVTVDARAGDDGGVADAIPWDTAQRLHRIPGVVAAATITSFSPNQLTRPTPITDPLSRNEISLDYVAASPELLETVEGSLSQGRFFDQGHSTRSDLVAVLGPGAADRLGVQLIHRQQSIYVGDTALTVIGILADVTDHDELLASVIIPEGTARKHFSLSAPTHLTIRTQTGHAQAIGQIASAAVNPQQPDSLIVWSPQAPQAIKEAVIADFNFLYLALGGVALVVGAVGIANVTLVGILERTGEIGLRRAVGATRTAITFQFLTESALTGLIGGTIGGSLGLLLIVAAAYTNNWIPVLPTLIPLSAPVAGVAIGLLSGLYPATRAAKLEPVEALRLGA